MPTEHQVAEAGARRRRRGVPRDLRAVPARGAPAPDARSAQDADDLVETLPAAWWSPVGFDGDSKLRTWLYRIATNPCLNAPAGAPRAPPRALSRRPCEAARASRPPPRHHRRTAHDRQRLALHLNHPRPRLPRTGHPPPPHPAAAPTDQRKAERFIRTMLGGWAYGALYGTNRERTAALDGWFYTYNYHRRHKSIGRQPPITRMNNLLGSYS